MSLESGLPGPPAPHPHPCRCYRCFSIFIKGPYVIPRELYPILVRALQAIPRELATQPPKPLAMQRVASLLTALTQLILAASASAPSR